MKADWKPLKHRVCRGLKKYEVRLDEPEWMEMEIICKEHSIDMDELLRQATIHFLLFGPGQKIVEASPFRKDFYFRSPEWRSWLLKKIEKDSKRPIHPLEVVGISQETVGPTNDEAFVSRIAPANAANRRLRGSSWIINITEEGVRITQSLETNG